MPDHPSSADPSPIERVRPLIRTRQIRDFNGLPLTDDELFAITEAARWSGSNSNSQPWRFIVIRDPSTLRQLADLGMPSTRSLQRAVAAVAIAIPAAKDRVVSYDFDDGRVAERMLVATTMLGIGGAIAWIGPDLREAARGILGIPDDWLVRTVVALGHPSEAAKAPKSAPGTARRPREETVFEERWPPSEA
jgi:nitroreductase